MVTRALGDTSLWIAVEQARPLRQQPPQDLLVSVITIGELRAGVLTAEDLASRSRRLQTLERAMRTKPLPVDDAVAVAWAQLRIGQHGSGRRMPINDSWIAATALAHGLPVATQDDDFDVVDGLEVIKL